MSYGKNLISCTILNKLKETRFLVVKLERNRVSATGARYR